MPRLLIYPVLLAALLAGCSKRYQTEFEASEACEKQASKLEEQIESYVYFEHPELDKGYWHYNHRYISCRHEKDARQFLLMDKYFEHMLCEPGFMERSFEDDAKAKHPPCSTEWENKNGVRDMEHPVKVIDRFKY